MQGCETTLGATVTLDTRHLSKPLECLTPGVSPEVNWGLQEMVTHLRTSSLVRMLHAGEWCGQCGRLHTCGDRDIGQRYTFLSTLLRT